MQLLVINLAGSEDGLPDLAANTTLPILQDTTEDGAAYCYGAQKWYIYVIDPAGVVRTVHYSLDLNAEASRLLAEISQAQSEAS